MTEEQIKAIEAAINKISEVITGLHSEITELQLQISVLENTKHELIRQLPNDNRLNRLFGY